MSGTSTIVVDPFYEDRQLAKQLFPGTIAPRECTWFARIMPILRRELEGVSVSELCEHLGIHIFGVDRNDFHCLINRLFRAGIIWDGHSGKTGVYGFDGPLRLTPNYWLKETARQQARPFCIVLPA